MKQRVRVEFVQYTLNKVIAAISMDVKGFTVQGRDFKEVNEHVKTGLEKMFYTTTGKQHTAVPIVPDHIKGEAFVFLVSEYDVELNEQDKAA